MMAGEKISAGEYVYSSLSKKIRNGTYKNGDKLPTENELAEHYGVSRNTVRSAIGKLSTLGLVETQQGSGTFVRVNDMTSRIESMIPLIFSGTNDYLAIMQLRLGIEIVAAERAAEVATMKDIQRIEEKLRDLEEHKDDLEYFSKADIQFHQAIVDVSANPILISLLLMIRSILDDVLSDFILEYGNCESLIAHRKIFECIKAADAEGAHIAMQKHIQTVINRYMLIRRQIENQNK